MNNALYTMPIEIRPLPTTIGASPANPGGHVRVGSPIQRDPFPNPGGTALAGAPIGQGSSLSWADVLKAVHGSSKDGHGGGLNKIQSSFDSGSDAFGASAASSDNSVDSFGTPSATPSSTASLIASISDPFSSIASNLQVRAQLQSQQLLDF